MGQIQSLIIVLGDLYLLKVSCEHPGLLILTASVASFVFVLLIYTLTLSFGDVGKTIAVVMVVIQIAGLSTYISSNGLVFDNKQPEINKVENGKEQGIVDEKEYITEVLSLKVSDGNLNETTLYEGTDVTASAILSVSAVIS